MPANWARGGAMLEVPRARWVVGTSVVEMYPDGRVLLNDSQEMTVDRAGRVFDTNNDPVALLETNGNVIGPGDKPLGNVGVLHASQVDSKHAWLSVMPTGEVLKYDDDGGRSSLGVWIGCHTSYSAHQACTLMSHLLAPKIIAASRPMAGMYPGSYMGPGMMTPGWGYPLWR